jgi:hypothetical protein
VEERSSGTIGMQLIVSTDYGKGVPTNIPSGATVKSILPDPSVYTAVYNRVVLSNAFVLSNLPDGADLEIYKTNPPMIQFGSDVTFDSSNLYQDNYRSPPSPTVSQQLSPSPTSPIAQQLSPSPLLQSGPTYAGTVDPMGFMIPKDYIFYNPVDKNYYISIKEGDYPFTDDTYWSLFPKYTPPIPSGPFRGKFTHEVLYNIGDVISFSGDYFFARKKSIAVYPTFQNLDTWTPVLNYKPTPPTTSNLFIGTPDYFMFHDIPTGAVAYYNSNYYLALKDMPGVNPDFSDATKWKVCTFTPPSPLVYKGLFDPKISYNQGDTVIASDNNYYIALDTIKPGETEPFIHWGLWVPCLNYSPPSSPTSNIMEPEAPHIVQALTDNKNTRFYKLNDNNYYTIDSLGLYHKVNLASNNLTITNGDLYPVPNSNIFDWEPKEPESLFVDDPGVSEPIRVLATGAAIGLSALGPQERYLFSEFTDWTPKLLQHTNFSIFQKVINLTSGPFLNNIVNCEIVPGESGDLIGQMYLKCTLPYNINLIDRVGVALVDKYELYFDNILVDTYDSDWFTIYNELFLSADEILALEPLINGSDLLIPMRFFFCNNEQRYLPLCAMKNQKVYIRIYFNPGSWFTDYAPQFDLTNVSIIYDTLFLTKQEKSYYMNTPITMNIPKYYRESPIDFTNAYANINLTANFNVSMIIWFIRNKAQYTYDYRKRYTYGYITDLVRSYTTYTDWRGNTKYYQQIFNDLQIFIQNKNIVSGIRDDLYYAYRQPMQHGLSIPDKNLYIYCFGDDIKSPTNNGFINFSKYPSKTTNMIITFNNNLTAELVKFFQLWFYYYGVTQLVFSGGYGTVLSVQ